jgi:hypothetical protein
VVSLMFEIVGLESGRGILEYSIVCVEYVVGV